MKFRLVYCIVVVILLCVSSHSLFSQGQPVQKSAQPSYLKHSISVTLGLTYPRTHSGLTAFWNQGPSEAMSFSVNVSRWIGLGVGFEIALLQFDEPAFRAAFPTVELQHRDIVLSHVYVGGRYNILPGMRTSPYLQATVGVSRMTEALYRKVIDGARVTYYHVGGSTRLTGGLAAGLDIYFNRALALELEARAIYAHNDSDLGIATSIRAGFRFNF
ncbi:MAG: hypothetical protein ACKVRP_01115 [Bacteroidota bacterium]